MGMKRLAATGPGGRSPTMSTRSCAAKVEASHGAYWHRRTQGGKPALHPDRERRDHRESHPNPAGAVRRGHADLIPIAAPLFRVLKHQLDHAPGSLVFPTPDGSQRSAEADPQKILRTALARAGLVEGYEHVCRWCGHKERHADNEQRYCPKCLKRTNGTGKPLANPRGRALWPKAIPRPMRFHDLRHTTATLLLRAGVDAHRVQRLLRHRDVRTTTTIYGHLDVEDLRAALAKLPELGPNWVQAAQSDPGSPSSVSTNSSESQDLTWWALQDSNLRPLPCESGSGGRQTCTSLIKSSQHWRSQNDHTPTFGTIWHPFFPRLGPNWVQCLSSKHFSARGSREAFLSVRQVAQLLHVSAATIYRLCEASELAHLRVSHAVRIAPADLVAYLKKKRTT